jgi:hypothetical protein
MTTKPDPTRYVAALVPDLAWIHQQCLAYIDQFPEPLHPLVRRYMERATPEIAQIEWCLPLWLGQTLAVPSATARTIGVINVLGMLYIRLQNDAMDGNMPVADQVYQPMLSSLLYTRCLALLATLFPPASPFWKYLEACMLEWATAIAWERERHWRRLEPYTEAEIRWLTAGKGAPEKICCAALTILAGKKELMPHLAQVMDLRSTVAQLFDDFCDWEEDWQHGRYNTFLTTVLSHGSYSYSRPAALSASEILQMIYRSPQVVEWFDRAERYAAVAQEAAAALACEPLVMLCHKAASLSHIYRQTYQEERERALLHRFSRLTSRHTRARPAVSIKNP